MTTVPKRPQFSPLRYPGGKAALFSLVSAAVRANGASGGTYVEPYAGGAGIALGLLLHEQVERVVINDRDPAIHAFWLALTSQPEGFMAKLASVEVSVDEWRRQREIYASADSTDFLSLGFATFFLNRTNRSGVLNAGVIGGKNQTGPYKIDARFNRKALLERCRLIALYSSRITVTSEDGIDVLDSFVGSPRTFVYADPPYYDKGSQLYLNAFSHEDHVRLADALNARASSSWMLTYDDNATISSLYESRPQYDLAVYYSVRGARKANELLIASDDFILPDGFVTPHAVAA